MPAELEKPEQNLLLIPSVIIKTPSEYFPEEISFCTLSRLVIKNSLSFVKTVSVGPQTYGRVGDEEYLLTVVGYVIAVI